MRKFLTFCKDVYHPGIHLYFALNWYVALHAALSMNHGRKLSFGVDSIIAVVTVFLVLFFLRIVDEIKDFDYDRVFNKDRPLIKGSVSHKNLYIYLVVTGLTVLLLNLNSGASALSILVIEIFYALLLIFIEKKSPLLKHHIVMNLLITYPVNILLSAYILRIDLFHWDAIVSDQDILLVFAFAYAFLYYEFARKISWPHQEKPGQRTYSAFFGTMNAFIVAELLAITGAAIVGFSYKTWLPLGLILPLVWGYKLLIRSKNNDRPAPMTLSGTAFIGLFYGIIIGLGVLDLFELSHYFLIWP